ncbi:hypothetical protein IQE94_18135 (plasmid) [Synechocystis sp. PCC 7339]|uniref:hypothetical protein n=1 Tax=Synechocystis sp. PCC 7339 TaxID=2782213 RepID=UPI001CBA89C4|nr:hypothetical protein [Synechocystis sp. PCC 7339]UAJ74587.1 hypothetical protein IQE94_18135 [Synechocystis sp. PCC 7339]
MTIKKLLNTTILLGLSLFSINNSPVVAYQDRLGLSTDSTSIIGLKETLFGQANLSNTRIQDMSFIVAEGPLKPNGCPYDSRSGGASKAPGAGSVELINQAGYTVKYSFAYMPASPREIVLGGVKVPVPEATNGTLVGANAIWSRKTFGIPEETANNIVIKVIPVGKTEPVIDLSFHPCDRVCLYTHGTIFNPSYTRKPAKHTNTGRSMAYTCE